MRKKKEEIAPEVRKAAGAPAGTPPDEEPTGSWLTGWSNTLERMAEQREQERLEWMRSLGEPVKMITLHEMEYGLFRVKGGIFMIPKRANGYHPHEVTEYSEELIRVLHDLL